VRARRELESLRDDLAVLGLAVADVDRAPPQAPAELREALDWLLEAAEPLTTRAE
jgi:hypothetical protein